MRNLIEKKRRLLELFVLSFITIFGIGSQFFSNLAYSLNQGVLQTSFGIGSEYLIIPSVVSNFAFAMGVPLGHIFTHRFGFKRNYLFFVFLFLLGSIMGLLSFDLVSLSIAKVTQSFSTGVLFFTLLPKLFITFPRRYRNVFLMMLVVGLFGANALGGLSGSLSLELDKWHWLFIINIISSMLCLLLGYFLLTKEEYLRKTETYISKPVITLLILSTLAIAFPMSILTHEGWESVLVWAPLLLAVLFIINFILFNARSEHPIIYFKSLLIKKPFVGAIMAIASHLTLLSGIAGINIYIIRILKLPFLISLRFYVFFFVGVLITGVVKMFFYSSVGAGILGTIGATSILFVSVNWLVLGRVVNVSFLYLQGILLGFGTSMTLISGAMATLLDGDLSRASERSQTMHILRNYSAAMFVPIIAYMMKSSVEKGVQSIDKEEIASTSTYLEKMQEIAINSDHKIFILMIILNIIMLASSITQIFLGKGRRITPL